MICIRSVLSFASWTAQVVAAGSNAVSFPFQNMEQCVWPQSPDIWCTLLCFFFFFYSSLCFGACCSLSSLKSLEVQSSSCKNVLSYDECIILPHLTNFF